MTKIVIQTNVVVHARIVGEMLQHSATLKTLADLQWHVKVSGPRPTSHHRYDMTRFEFLAERAVTSDENVSDIRQALMTALGADE